MAFPSDLVRTKAWGTEVLTSSDLHGQLDLIINWVMAALNATTGHSHDGTSNQGPEINITNLTVSSQAAGDLIYASSASAWARLALGTAGKFLQVNSGATAPEWDTISRSDLPAGTVLQYVTAKSSAKASGTGIYTIDDNIPANTAGNALAALDLTITPSNASNILEFSGVIYLANDTTACSMLAIALHQDLTANAIDWCVTAKAANDVIHAVPFYFTVAAGTTSSTTFKLYYGGNSASRTTVNGFSDARKGGGVLYSTFTVKELKA